MVYRPTVDEKLCFVLMPFGQPFDQYYQHVIKPALNDLGMSALRSDEIYGTKAIIKDIWSHIFRAKIVIADVSGKNPNVNYELGLCHSLGVPTVIISHEMGDVPFDYRHRRCILYNRTEAGWDDLLKEKLKKTIASAIQTEDSGEDLPWPYDTNQLREGPSLTSLVAGESPRRVVIDGASRVAEAVGPAYGPHGTQVSFATKFGASGSYLRGVEIASHIHSANPLEERGIEHMCSAARELDEAVGNGCKSTVLLCAALLRGGQNILEKGVVAQEFVTFMGGAVEEVLKYLRNEKKPCKVAQLLNVASTAADGDSEVAQRVLNATQRAGKDGLVVIEESRDAQTTVDVQEGVQFDRGYLSEHFITDQETLKCELHDCSVLICEGIIGSLRELLPLLEHVARSGRPLLIIAEDVQGEALATLIVNKLKGVIRCAAVKAPGFSDRRRSLLEDIAVVTGGRAITRELGMTLGTVEAADLGSAKKVVVTTDTTTIFGGGGQLVAIEKRARNIRNLIESTMSEYDQAKLRERLAILTGSIVIIRVGGQTPLDIIREKYKIESALKSLMAAMESGWLPGGGVALFRAADHLRETTIASRPEATARIVVADALEAPISQIILNCHRSPTETLTWVRKSSELHTGFNAETGQIQDVVTAGILDAASQVELALQIAFSHAKVILQTGAWDISIPPRKE